MAIITISNTGGNWNNTATWIGGVVPTSADDVIATVLSGPLTINVSSAAKSVDFTNYVNTLTMTALLTVSGNVTLVTAMTIVGAAGLAVAATSTLTSNGKIWPNDITLSSFTYTFADVWTITGTVSCSTSAVPVIDGSTINVGGSVSFGSNSVTGTATIVMNGTGTLSGGTNTAIRLNITFDTAGTITIGNFYFGGATLTYVTGTMVISGSLSLGQFGGTIINTSGMTWASIGFATSATVTITSNLNCSGNVAGNGITLNGLFDFNIGGSFTINSGGFSGTTSIVLNGTGTLSGTGILRNNLTINTAGTITISGTVGYNTGTLTYTAGIVDTTGSTLSLSNVGTPTLATNGISWNNITITTGTTVTLTNALDVNGTFTYGSGGSPVTLNGSTATFSGSITASGTSDVGSTLSGTTNIIIDGTGTWSHSSTFNATITNNLTINTTGTLTLGSRVGYNTGTLTYIAGDVDTSGSTLAISATTTLDLGLMPTPLNNLTVTGASQTITLLSDLYVSGTVTLSSSGTPVWTGNTLYIGGNLTHSTNSIQTGTTTFVMNGTGTWTSTSINQVIRNNFTINTTGKITFGAIIAYNTGTFTYLSGKVVVPKNAIMYITASTTLINCHKINFETVQLNAAQTFTMNEFFSGSPNKPVKVISSSTSNYNVTFQNGYEKIAKFVKVSNLTLTNTAASKGSLLILNNKGKYFRGSNNIGNIKYTNQSPNGIAKGEPTVPNQMTAPIGGYLSDPVFN